MSADACPRCGADRCRDADHAEIARLRAALVSLRPKLEDIDAGACDAPYSNCTGHCRHIAGGLLADIEATLSPPRAETP